MGAERHRVTPCRRHAVWYAAVRVWTSGDAGEGLSFVRIPAGRVAETADFPRILQLLPRYLPDKLGLWLRKSFRQNNFCRKAARHSGIGMLCVCCDSVLH